MPPKKKDTTTAASSPVRRSARNSNKTAAAASEDTVATPPPAKPATKKTTPKPKPASKAADDTDMGSAASAIKKAKAKKSTKASKGSKDEAVPSTIEVLGADDTNASANSKRKTAPVNSTPDDTPATATSTKKARLSKAEDVEPGPSQSTPAKKSTSMWKSQPKTVDEWYRVYASSDDPDQIDFDGIASLLEDLNIKLDGASIYIICWKLECEAMGVIPRDKWIKGMSTHGLKNNTQLLKSLGTWLQETKPTNPASESFLKFYKFMFNFSKATPETRSVQAESAIAVLTFLLNPLTYDVKYDPETSTDLSADKHPYPHTEPFLRFLTEKQPVKVINRDQWDSFVPFNKSVNYNLDNYNPEGAWPNLYDQYVEWRKETEGLEIGPKDGPDTEV